MILRTAFRRCVVVLWSLLTIGESTSFAQVEKWADPPYIQLSKNLTPAVKALPNVGKIDWKLDRIPFIDDSPRAGISGAGMVAARGEIYLLGGFIPAGDGSADRSTRRTSRWAYRYYPPTNNWTRLPDMPGRREYTRAIATSDAIYVVGGSMQRKGDPRGELVSNECFKLDLSKKKPVWEAHGNLTVPRTHMGVGRVGDYLIVAGGVKWDPENGYHESTIKNTTDVFDLSKPELGWRSRSPIPGVGRGWVASSACRELFYVFSGLTFDSKKTSTWVDQCLKYDPQSDQWTRISNPPVWVSGWEGATHRERFIILVGGCVGPTVDPYSNGNLWNDLAFVYDTESNRWGRMEGTIPPAGVYNDAGVAIIGDTIYVAGGEGPRGSHFNHFAVGRIKLQ